MLVLTIIFLTSSRCRLGYSHCHKGCVCAEPPMAFSVITPTLFEKANWCYHKARFRSGSIFFGGRFASRRGRLDWWLFIFSGHICKRSWSFSLIKAEKIWKISDRFRADSARGKSPGPKQCVIGPSQFPRAIHVLLSILLISCRFPAVISLSAQRRRLYGYHTTPD